MGQDDLLWRYLWEKERTIDSMRRVEHHPLPHTAPRPFPLTKNGRTPTEAAPIPTVEAHNLRLSYSCREERDFALKQYSNLQTGDSTPASKCPLLYKQGFSSTSVVSSVSLTYYAFPIGCCTSNPRALDSSWALACRKQFPALVTKTTGTRS